MGEGKQDKPDKKDKQSPRTGSAGRRRTGEPAAAVDPIAPGAQAEPEAAAVDAPLTGSDTAPSAAPEGAGAEASGAPEGAGSDDSAAVPERIDPESTEETAAPELIEPESTDRMEGAPAAGEGAAAASDGDDGEGAAAASDGGVAAAGGEPGSGEAASVFELTPPDAGEAVPADVESTGGVPLAQLEAAIESLLYASDKPLGVNELKRLVGVRDTKAVNAAIEALCDRRADSGIVVVNVAGGWQLRTNPAFGAWVGKLLAGKPVRLSRAMLETLAIIAYRQPVTRPELDEIRGVDCGPVLGTLLDRNLIRIIGKKEEVGRPMLYGTTGEFLRIFSLKDLTELPTLRQFHELSAEHQERVKSTHGEGGEGEAAALAPDAAPVPTGPLARANIGPDPEEDDGLLEELDRATDTAARAAGPLHPEPETAAPANPEPDPVS
jgi:segregation and condensation protein B